MLLKDNAAEGKSIYHAEAPTALVLEGTSQESTGVMKSPSTTNHHRLPLERQREMFIICKNYLCCCMTHSCPRGLLSSAAKESLLSYKACKSHR